MLLKPRTDGTGAAAPAAPRAAAAVQPVAVVRPAAAGAALSAWGSLRPPVTSSSSAAHAVVELIDDDDDEQAQEEEEEVLDVSAAGHAPPRAAATTSSSRAGRGSSAATKSPSKRKRASRGSGRVAVANHRDDSISQDIGWYWLAADTTRASDDKVKGTRQQWLINPHAKRLDGSDNHSLPRPLEAPTGVSGRFKYLVYNSAISGTTNVYVPDVLMRSVVLAGGEAHRSAVFAYAHKLYEGVTKPLIDASKYVYEQYAKLSGAEAAWAASAFATGTASDMLELLEGLDPDELTCFENPTSSKRCYYVRSKSEGAVGKYGQLPDRTEEYTSFMRVVASFEEEFLHPYLAKVVALYENGAGAGNQSGWLSTHAEFQARLRTVSDDILRDPSITSAVRHKWKGVLDHVLQFFPISGEHIAHPARFMEEQMIAAPPAHVTSTPRLGSPAASAHPSAAAAARSSASSSARDGDASTRWGSASSAAARAAVERRANVADMDDNDEY